MQVAGIDSKQNPALDGPLPPTLWLHVGYCNFQLMHWTGLSLKFVKSINHGRDDITNVLLEVENPCSFQRSFEFFRDRIQFDYSYVASFWMMVSTDTALPQSQMLPKKVLVTPFDKIPPLIVWKGKDEERNDRRDIEERRNRRRKKNKQPKKHDQKITKWAQSRPRKRMRKIEDSGRAGDAVDALCVNIEEEAENDSPISDTGSQVQSDHDHETDSDNDDELAVAAVRDNMYLQDIESQESDDGNCAGFTSQSEAMDGLDSDLASDDDAVPHHDDGNDNDSDDDPDHGGPAGPVAVDSDLAIAATETDSGQPASSAPAAPDAGQPSSSSSRAAEFGRVMNPDEIEITGYGSIKFYATTQHMSAFCTYHKERDGVDCRKSRTVRAAAANSTHGSRLGQGRPIGLLCAWLLNPDSHAESRSAVPKYEQRCEARELFNQMQGSSVFAQHERTRRPNEEEEPKQIP